MKLPDSLRLGPVRLAVSDLQRSLAYYEPVLGLTTTPRPGNSVHLTSASGDTLVILDAHPEVAPLGRRSRLGLFHFALLLPDRPALGRFVSHLHRLGLAYGEADHLVSEAIYLSDPDGLGIEVYADRPRNTWGRRDGEILMDTLPLDIAGVVASAGGAAWDGMPAGAVMGHVHLHVGDLAAARAHYADALGLDITLSGYPGALFMSAGGYHHHLGVNTWAGPNATPAGPGDARLLEWTMVLPGETEVERAAARMAAAGRATASVDGGAVITDPWDVRLRVVAG